MAKPHELYTVTLTFEGGAKFTRDLRDINELERYMISGVAWNIVERFEVVRNPILHPES